LVEEPRVSTQVRLPKSLYARLKLAAEDRDVSANRILTRALTEFLDRLEPSEVVLSTVKESERRQAG
jgi:predicted transcriptional regulator